ncbi:MAG: DUF3179 domain-containing protein [Actinomycetota bacterium]|nr:DUF3179 domain-containing protein [Actinomycetota bacterium]
MRRSLLLITAVLVALGVGIGAFALSRGGESSIAAALAEVERELATTPLPRVGLGEASPPPALTEGWQTNFEKRLVPLSEFQSGGPGKDGIPAIDVPRFAPVRETRFLEPQEPLIELVVDGKTRGYPIQILIWHEIANDEIAGVPVSVTFCPLCNTAVVFDRRVKARVLDFGVSGNLRNSDLVMYDRQTESWWQQFGGQALVGELAGTRLRKLPARIVSWAEFQREHAEGEVLTRDTGNRRSYGQNPYPGYDDVSSPPYFPTRNADDRRLPAKARVVLLESGDEAAVVPHSVLASRGPARALRPAVLVRGRSVSTRRADRSLSGTQTRSPTRLRPEHRSEHYGEGSDRSFGRHRDAR